MIRIPRIFLQYLLIQMVISLTLAQHYLEDITPTNNPNFGTSTGILRISDIMLFQNTTSSQTLGFYTADVDKIYACQLSFQNAAAINY